MRFVTKSENHSSLSHSPSVLSVYIFWPILTYEFEKVPVEDIVIRESLPMEQVPEQLPQIRVVRLFFKS